MRLTACMPVSSGSDFLRSTIEYLDCAGRMTGSEGFAGLAQSGSAMSQIILTAMTVFIAWHGIRMMFGRRLDIGDLVLAVAKIGIVLTLVASWPAVRTLIADPAFDGPFELLAQAQSDSQFELIQRLQRVDDGIVAMTKWGTGKLDIRAGQTSEGASATGEFAGIAFSDALALALGRTAFLIGALLYLGLLRLLTGIMIAALPIMAGLLLFDTTRGLFLGWLRLLFALFIGGFAIPLVLAIELSLLEPWLARIIEERSAFFATPSAPTELVAITASFLLILAATMAMIAKACFCVDLATLARKSRDWGPAAILASERFVGSTNMSSTRRATVEQISRADSLATSLRRLSASADREPNRGAQPAIGQATVLLHRASLGRGASTPTGSPQRSRQRMSRSQSSRDQR